VWPTTDAYLEALLAGSRTWTTKVEVLYAGQIVTTLSVVVDGAVSIDEVAVRRSLDMTLVDPDGTLTPADARDLLAPKGTEIRIYKGLMVNGAIEEVPLGVFGVTKPVVSAHNPGTQVKITAFDRVDSVRLHRFEVPWHISAGTLTTDAIGDIITSRLNCPVRVTSTGNTTNEVVYDELSDPWKAVQDLAAADSLVAYFDPLGTAVIAPEGETDTGITYQPGEQSMLLKTERSIESDRTYSGVIVKAEHPDAEPIRVVVWDENPSSPTYWQGPFGKRPYGFSSPLITTVDMATEAANTILARVSQMRQEARFTTVGHPGHDVGDVVTIIDPESRTSGRWTIYGGKVPLRLGPIEWKVRTALT
jgi:hypothetical protein